MANLADNLFLQADRRGTQPALRFGDDCFSFADIAARVRQIAGGLGSIGVGVGSRVGLMMASQPEFIFYEHAIFALGATFSPLNIFYRTHELVHSIHSCELDFLVLGEEFLDRLPAPGNANLSCLRAILTPTMTRDSPRMTRSIEKLMAESLPLTSPVQMPESAIGMMLNTSATTGKSKGVMLSIGNVRSNYDRTPAWLGLNSDTITLCALPLYNTFGLNQCVNALMVTGGTLILMDRFDAGTCIERIERHRCNFLPAVPTMLQKLIDHPDAVTRDLSSVLRIMTGGAPVPEPLLERIQRAMGGGTVLYTGYGLTEATALVTLDRRVVGIGAAASRPKTIGRVLDGMEIAILDDDGHTVGVGDIGEICLRGPNIMLGYHRMPEDTDAALAGGWLHTGDIGYLDSDGYAYIVDRKKDIIIRGGQNIYPADIEEVIYGLPGVREVAVVRRADSALGEVPIAFIAVAPDTALTAEAVIDHCKSELAYFKVPAAVHFLAELPKGPTGKILRRGLSQMS